jgi:hypothetical protein
MATWLRLSECCRVGAAARLRAFVVCACGRWDSAWRATGPQPVGGTHPDRAGESAPHLFLALSLSLLPAPGRRARGEADALAFVFAPALAAARRGGLGVRGPAARACVVWATLARGSSLWGGLRLLGDIARCNGLWRGRGGVAGNCDVVGCGVFGFRRGLWLRVGLGPGERVHVLSQLPEAVGYLPVVPSPASGCERAGRSHHLAFEVADAELVVRGVEGDPAGAGIVGRRKWAAGAQAGVAFFVRVVCLWWVVWSHGRHSTPGWCLGM